MCREDDAQLGNRLAIDRWGDMFAGEAGIVFHHRNFLRWNSHEHTILSAI